MYLQPRWAMTEVFRGAMHVSEVGVSTHPEGELWDIFLDIFLDMGSPTKRRVAVGLFELLSKSSGGFLHISVLPDTPPSRVVGKVARAKKMRVLVDRSSSDENDAAYIPRN